MRESRIIDQFAVESEYGIRSFNIYEGDIFDKGTELSLQEKPLLVLSTHSSKYSAPAGAVLEKLQEQLGRSLNLDKSPLLSWRGISVFFEETEDFDFKGVLTLRIPRTNIEALSSSVSLFEEVLDVFTSSLTVLESLGFPFDNVFFPIIAGQRISEILPSNASSYKKALEIMIEKSKIWLETSKHCASLNLFVYESEKLELVKNALYTIRERHSIRGDIVGDILSSLINQVTDQICSLQNLRVSASLKRTLNDLKQLLGYEPVSIQSINSNSRIVIEYMAKDLINAFEIETPDDRLYTLIDSLRSKLSPWVISYMHAIRLIGNSCSHSSNLKRGYVPENMEKSDLLAVLGALTNLLSLWINIREQNLRN
ncbi:hypothetical protein [Mesotoga sp. H07.pep.5.3]|uniref:hypothetical protein n=1 Tax=Mesotoga sp. H07.pep.5.3 TaxID=1421003 RepID=UPI000C198435|nr:hypothetical protein [Mesotoga sp. H07.pep.5.3]PIJ61038.1 hypothetical protein V513_10740 [Mesotoga sp. H07.pep.5.3]